MRIPENQGSSIRLLFICTISIATMAVVGCGSGASTGMSVTRVSVNSTPGTSSPAPIPISTPIPVPDVKNPGQPASHLADLSRGAIWEYSLSPGEADGSSDSSPFRHRRVALVPAGSPLTVTAEHAATDINLPGSLIRLVGTVTATGGDSSARYRYDGTYRQDTATRDIYLLRLPSGELLDTPARVLPGTWELGTKIRSHFTVAGEVKAEYSLTVDSSDVIDTSIGRKPVWLTQISINWFEPKNKGHYLTSKQWFEPTTGSYLQAASRDAATILNDLTLIEILDDEKLSFYTVNP